MEGGVEGSMEEETEEEESEMNPECVSDCVAPSLTGHGYHWIICCCKAQKGSLYCVNFIPGAGSLVVVIRGVVSKERTRHALIKLVVASRLIEGE